MAYHIRRIVDRDWDSIIELEAAAYTGHGLSEGRVALASRASPDTSCVLDTGDRIVGYLLALPYPRFRYPDLERAERFAFRSSNLHLHDLLVADGFRGNGLAKRLLRHLADTARSKMYERISLIAVGGSHTFWFANGYRPHSEVSLPIGYGADAVYMSMTIRDGRTLSQVRPAARPGRPREDEEG
jgi:ornithine decarboxylase